MSVSPINLIIVIATVAACVLDPAKDLIESRTIRLVLTFALSICSIIANADNIGEKLSGPDTKSAGSITQTVAVSDDSGSPSSQWTSEEGDLSSEEYILPESNTRCYTREELEGLTNRGLWMARNEIYARNGRMFNNSEAQEYFNSKSWYEPRYTPDEFDRGGRPQVFNEYERANRDLIEQIEISRGSTYPR